MFSQIEINASNGHVTSFDLYPSSTEANNQLAAELKKRYPVLKDKTSLEELSLLKDGQEFVWQAPSILVPYVCDTCRNASIGDSSSSSIKYHSATGNSEQKVVVVLADLLPSENDEFSTNL